ncbi:MAG TPA: arsenate reductase ArsC [Thermoanaerobaculia bacterium]
MSDQKTGVLVLCTGNSCRSQMAQAFLERHGGDRFAVYSAGSEPAPEVHPLTVRVMREADIDLSGRRPRHLDEYLGKVAVHTLITVCDAAAKSCPAVWPGVRQRLAWPFEDPASFAGTDEERIAKFREVRDAIEARVRDWVGSVRA